MKLRLHRGSQNMVWIYLLLKLSLILAGLMCIHYHPAMHGLVQSGDQSLITCAIVLVLIGFTITINEGIQHLKRCKELKKLEGAKKVRHEYRRHIQNVQALLYIEAFDEACEYAQSLEKDLRSI